MPSITGYLYIVSADWFGVLFVSTSKQKAWDFLLDRKGYVPTTISSYWAFSQFLKHNNPCQISCDLGRLDIQRVTVNHPQWPLDNLFSGK